MCVINLITFIYIIPVKISSSLQDKVLFHLDFFLLQNDFKGESNIKVVILD